MPESPQRPHLLIVDDEPMIVEAWQEVCSEWYHVTGMTDPQKARQFVSKNEIDAAVIDLRMPKLDGIQLLEAIKAAQPNAEVIILTGDGTVECAVKAMRQGAFDFLTKPIEDMDAALETVGRAVKRKISARGNCPGYPHKAHTTSRESQASTFEAARTGGLDTAIERAAQDTAPVILTGDPGAEFQIICRRIHEGPHTSEGPLLHLSCRVLAQWSATSHEELPRSFAACLQQAMHDSGTLLLADADKASPRACDALVHLMRDAVTPPPSTDTTEHKARIVISGARGGLNNFLALLPESTQVIDIPSLASRPQDVAALAQAALAAIDIGLRPRFSGLHRDAIDALIHEIQPASFEELRRAVMQAARQASRGEIRRVHIMRAAQR